MSSHNTQSVPSVTSLSSLTEISRKSSGTESHNRSTSQKGIFFLISRKVTIAYGPYMNLGVIDYRTERLEGLKKALLKMGGEPICIPSYHINRVRVWHLEHEIFSCIITDLQHGGDGDMDRLCIEAARALDRSARKAYYNLKNRYKLQMNLNAGCPCHSAFNETEVIQNTQSPTIHGSGNSRHHHNGFEKRRQSRKSIVNTGLRRNTQHHIGGMDSHGSGISVSQDPLDKNYQRRKTQGHIHTEHNHHHHHHHHHHYDNEHNPHSHGSVGHNLHHSGHTGSEHI